MFISTASINEQMHIRLRYRYLLEWFLLKILIWVSVCDQKERVADWVIDVCSTPPLHIHCKSTINCNIWLTHLCSCVDRREPIYSLLHPILWLWMNSAIFESQLGCHGNQSYVVNSSPTLVSKSNNNSSVLPLGNSILNSAGFNTNFTGVCIFYWHVLVGRIPNSQNNCRHKILTCSKRIVWELSKSN